MDSAAADRYLLDPEVFVMSVPRRVERTKELVPRRVGVVAGIREKLPAARSPATSYGMLKWLGCSTEKSAAAAGTHFGHQRH